MEVQFYHVKEIWSEAGQCTLHGAISPPYCVLLELEVQNSSHSSSFTPIPIRRKQERTKRASYLSFTKVSRMLSHDTSANII